MDNIADHMEGQWQDWRKAPPQIQFQPTQFDWILLDIIPPWDDRRFLPPVYRFKLERLIPSYLCIPYDKDNQDNHIVRFHLRNYIAPFVEDQGQWLL